MGSPLPDVAAAPARKKCVPNTLSNINNKQPAPNTGKKIALRMAVNHKPQTVRGMSKYPIPGALSVITVVI